MPIILTLFMLFNMLPQSVFAEDEGVSYYDPKTMQTTLANEVTLSDTEWTPDNDSECWYVVNGEVNISSRITVIGDVNLILINDCTFTAEQSIGVSEDNSLTIWGKYDLNGSLIATGGNYKAVSAAQSL